MVRRKTWGFGSVWLAAATATGVLVCLCGMTSLACAETLRAIDASLDQYGTPARTGPDWRDDAIRRSFHEVLQREPRDSELRRYRYRMAEERMTEREVVEDLRSRGDYRRMSGRRGDEVDTIIRLAYDDILHRPPDRDGLLLYRSRILNEGWTEYDLRETLRSSPEAFAQRREYADRVIRRAYQDVLRREPDPGGMDTYRNRILNDGWDQQDVWQALRRSPEKSRQRFEMNRERAEEMVRRAYQNVLRREPDPQGLKSFVDHVLRDRWTQEELERVLRDSDEYRRMRR
jgi:hypothetical protein